MSCRNQQPTPRRRLLRCLVFLLPWGASILIFHYPLNGCRGSELAAQSMSLIMVSFSATSYPELDFVVAVSVDNTQVLGLPGEAFTLFNDGKRFTYDFESESEPGESRSTYIESLFRVTEIPQGYRFRLVSQEPAGRDSKHILRVQVRYGAIAQAATFEYLESTGLTTPGLPGQSSQAVRPLKPFLIAGIGLASCLVVGLGLLLIKRKPRKNRCLQCGRLLEPGISQCIYCDAQPNPPAELPTSPQASMPERAVTAVEQNEPDALEPGPAEPGKQRLESGLVPEPESREFLPSEPRLESLATESDGAAQVTGIDLNPESERQASQSQISEPSVESISKTVEIETEPLVKSPIEPPEEAEVLAAADEPITPSAADAAAPEQEEVVSGIRKSDLDAAPASELQSNVADGGEVSIIQDTPSKPEADQAESKLDNKPLVTEDEWEDGEKLVASLVQTIKTASETAPAIDEVTPIFNKVYYVEVVDPEGRTTRVVLSPDREYLVGAGLKADVLVEDPIVHQLHAKIYQEAGVFMLESLRPEATFIMNQQSYTKVQIPFGNAQVLIGATTLLFDFKLERVN